MAGPLIRVYVDDHEPDNRQEMHRDEHVDDWHQSPIRQGVTTGGEESQEFIRWKSQCLGRVVLQPEPVDSEGNYTKIPRWYVYIEKQEDLVSYILTFGEPVPRMMNGEAAAYYCPYIPLTYVGIVPPHQDDDA